MVAWHPDRLTRHPRELEDLIDAIETGHVQVETVRAGRWDLSTRSGRTTARLIGTVARDESEAKAERLQAMHADLARQGKWSGGTRPFGYEPDGSGSLTVVDDESAIIHEASRRVLKGEWLGSIARDLNQRGVPTVRGADWRVETLRRILTSHTVAGRRQHRGKDLGPAAWPAIIDLTTWHQLRARLIDARRRRGTMPRVALLAGLAVCGLCGTQLISQRRGDSSRRRVMVCPSTYRGGCGGIQIAAERLEEQSSNSSSPNSSGPTVSPRWSTATTPS